MVCHGKNGPPQIGSPRNQLFIDKYGPPGTYFTAKFGPPLKNLDHPLELILLINKDRAPGTYFTATFGPPPPTTIWTTPLELILLINKDPRNLFHRNIWTPSGNNYMSLVLEHCSDKTFNNDSSQYNSSAQFLTALFFSFVRFGG